MDSSSWWGEIIGTTQNAVGDWYENELQAELGLDSAQEDAQRGTTIGFALPSAGREQIDHGQQQIAGAGIGISSQTLLLMGVGLVLAVLAFKASR